MFSDAVEVWIAERRRGGWTEKTALDHRACIDRFIEVVGDKSIDAYGRSDGRRFKAVLMSLPANARKLKALAGLPLPAAAKRAEALGLTPMTLSTANKTLRRVSAFWNWAEKHYDEAPRNPLRDLTVPTRVSARDERSPFSLEVLNRIFASPLFTGCRSVSACSTPGPLVPRHSGRFWAPLIGLFSGLRLGEIIQLEATDLREIEGVLVFDINDNHPDKRLKTSNAARLVPVHRALVEAGLMSHLDGVRAKRHRRLFEDLKKGRDGYYSSPFSKFFTRYLAQIGAAADKTSFHSFRHNFEDACREGGVSKEVMDALQGHAEGGMSGRYGSGHSMGAKADAMARIAYPGLKLDHLLASSKASKQVRTGM